MKCLIWAVLTCAICCAGTAFAEEQEHHSRGADISEWLEEKGVSRDVTIAAISTLPIVELRGAVPAGFIVYEVNGLECREWSEEEWTDNSKTIAKIYMLAVAGNMLPIPFILLLLGPASSILMRFKIGKKFFDWLFARTRRKSASIERYEALGLTIFVAIPLPITGGWTGSMAAFLMGISFWKAMLYVLLGVMIAGVIMTVLSLLGWIGAIIAGVVLIGLASVSLMKSFKG